MTFRYEIGAVAAGRYRDRADPRCEVGAAATRAGALPLDVTAHGDAARRRRARRRRAPGAARRRRPARASRRSGSRAADAHAARAARGPRRGSALRAARHAGFLGRERASEPSRSTRTIGPAARLVTETPRPALPAGAGRRASIGSAAHRGAAAAVRGDPMLGSVGGASRRAVRDRERRRCACGCGRCRPARRPASTARWATSQLAWSARPRPHHAGPAGHAAARRARHRQPAAGAHAGRSSRPDFEVFASTVDDSFAPPGRDRAGAAALPVDGAAAARRLARARAAGVAWFDPAAARLPLGGRCRRSGSRCSRRGRAPRPATRAASRACSAATRRAGPGARGAAVGVRASPGCWSGSRSRCGARAGRRTIRTRRAGAQREWLRAVGLAHGPDFWRAADEAATWAEARGERARCRAGHRRRALRRHRARRGRRAPPPRRARRGGRAGRAAPRAPRRALALVLAGSPSRAAGWGAAARQRAARGAGARGGRAARERSSTRRAPSGCGCGEKRGRPPALAARLSWSALGGTTGVAEAAVWTLRGSARRAAQRRASLGRRARARGRRAGRRAARGGGPLRTLEWAGARVRARARGAARRPRRWSAAALLALASAAAAAPPLLHARLAARAGGGRARADPAVGARTRPRSRAGGARRERAAGDRARVRAGRGAEGEVPADAILEVWATAP